MAEEMQKKNSFKIGTRKSQLAMVQTEHVASLLSSAFPALELAVVARTTVGDQRLDVALNKIGEKSLFTKELEVCLENGEVDLVVHSLKDLPTVLPEGMVIGAILEREDPRDALVVRRNMTDKVNSIDDLPVGATVGTSSLKAQRPHLKIKDVRGNLNTRFKKLDDGEDYDALVLAAAGITRLGWKDRITQLLDSRECLHAVGQGALAVECRAGDRQTLALLSPLRHRSTALESAAERAFMRRLEGGCSAPVAAHAKVSADGRAISLEGGVWSLDGTQERRGSVDKALPPTNAAADAPLEMEQMPGWAEAEEAGYELAEALLRRGAGPILEEAKRQTHEK